MKTVSLVILVLAILGCAYLGIGALSLKSGNLAVDNANGKVWNQIDIGSQKLAALEAQVLGAYNQQNTVVLAITEGRKSFEAARSTGDIEAATKAAGQIAVNVKALTEASPVTDLTPVQTSLMDETAEVFNQIGYLRGKLIDAQTSYNWTRFIFFPIAGFFPSVEILGSTANPAQAVPTSIFAPTPVK